MRPERRHGQVVTKSVFVFDHLLLSILFKRQLQILDGKSSQEYPFRAGVPKGFIFGPMVCKACLFHY